MFKLIKRLTAGEWGMIVASIAFIVLAVYADLELPSYMSEVTTLLQTEGTKVSDLYDPASKMLGFALLSFAAIAVVGFIAARLAAAYTTRLRSDIYNQVMDYSQTEVKKFSIPSLLTRTTNDLTQIQMLITMGLQVVVRGPIMAVWAMTKIAGKSGEWMTAVAVAVVAVMVMLLRLLFLAFPKQQHIQTATDELNAITRESLKGIRVVRAYNAEDYQDSKFSSANNLVTGLNLFVNRVMALMSPVMTLVSSGLTLAIYWIGAYLIDAAEMTDKISLFSDMVVFSSYGMQVIMGFMLMMALFLVLPRALVSANRINEVLSYESSIKSPQTSKETDGQVGEVEFKDVSFKYSKSSEPVIEHVSFKAQKGQTVAFIGSTGSGKSTLINLIPRFYDVTEGQILVDGVDVRDYNHQELNKKVGYIPQKAVLFSGTIRSNIDMGESSQGHLSDEQIWEALELAQGADFVREKEAGLDTEVAQGGTNFSGGQRQRLAIARALARKPEMLIFDDSFSALDYKTDRVLRETLLRETADMTKLIVAQRISTIMDADLILVLEEGKVVGQGTHKELLANNPVYQEIAYSQLSKEELEDEN